jgi:cytochrome c-type biogenesis protein
VNVSIALAFAAGFLSFASPCVLALIPVYLAFLGETASVPAGSPGSPGSTGQAAAPAEIRPVVGQALLFVAGFSAVFVLLGTPIGILGQGLFQIGAVRQVAGVAVIGLGLLTTGIFGPVLDRLTVSGPGADALPPGRVARALSLGAFVAIGWTPCIGTVLGTILAMGASSGQAVVAFLLLVSYSAGLAVPFLLAAVALPRMRPLIGALRRHHAVVRGIAGIFIVGIGILIFANAFSRMASLFTIL